jgi:hypothetical protein
VKAIPAGDLRIDVSPLRAKAAVRQRDVLLARQRTTAALAFAVSVVSAIVGCLSLGFNSLDAYSVPLLGVLALTLLSLALHVRRVSQQWDRTIVILSGLSLASAILVRVLPEYVYGLHVNAIVHRSLFSALFLLCVAVPASCSALYYLLEASPEAEDISHYPLIILPVFLVLAGYGLLMFRVMQEGLPHLDLGVIAAPYRWDH